MASSFGSLTFNDQSSETFFPAGHALGGYVTTGSGDVWQGPASPIVVGEIGLNAQGTTAQLAALYNAQGTTATLTWGISVRLSATARLLEVSQPQSTHPTSTWRWPMKFRIEGAVTVL